jgi:hypothetical protein
MTTSNSNKSGGVVFNRSKPFWGSVSDETAEPLFSKSAEATLMLSGSSSMTKMRLFNSFPF